VTVELLKGVFEAAAEFYRAAPWIRLSNEQVIAVQHPNEPNYHSPQACIEAFKKTASRYEG
jgi:hypothetical protein